MIRKFLSILLCSLLAVTTCALAQGQERHTPPAETAKKKSETPEEKTKREALEAKALVLLDEVLKEAAGLRLVENRVRLQAMAGDILWNRDQPRARAIFKLATTGLIEIQRRDESQMRAITDSDDVASSMPEIYQQNMLNLQWSMMLRQEVLNIISKRDARLARDVLLATRANYPSEGGQAPAWANADKYAELNIAAQIADSDPKEAVKIGEQSIDEGLVYELPGLVSRIMLKDRDAAAKLAAKIVAKLRTEDLNKAGPAASVALSLLRTGLGQVEQDQSASANGKTAPSTFDDQLLRELMDMVVTAALDAHPPARHTAIEDADEEDDAGGELLAALRGMMPEVQRYAPTKAAALKTAMDEFDKKLDPRSRVAQDVDKVIEGGSVDAMIETAEKMSGEQKDALYSQASYAALSKGDTDRARQIALEHISDPNKKRGLLAAISQRSLWEAGSQGKIDEARAMLMRLSPESRAAALVNFAGLAAGKGNKKLAFDLLSEARGLMSPVPANAMQMQTQLSLVSAYASLESPIAFDIIEPMIDQFNGLLSAAAVLDGFEYSRFFKDGEIISQNAGQVVSSAYQCARTLSTLAKLDFERSKSCADRFDRLELRLGARLLIAQGILSDKPAAVVPNGPTIDMVRDN